ncbi:MAG: tripartite tricarboxylate transporter substrate binding protein BugD [Xanthobacteraceae bacterium]|nr:tripartite tricarboxylate transporter substrate binding protein BugD [Xanthobacteraceae bacterium]
MFPGRAAAVLTALLSIVVALAAAIAPAAAQSYPNRPITIIVPFAAGGPTDVLARVLGERMRTALGQPVLIENVTGAGGSIGVGRVVSAPPDGYTISIGHFGTHVANGAIYPLKYNLLKDLDPVARLPSNPMIFVTRKDFPAANLKELIERLKANPGKIAAGTAGAGSGSHIASLLLQSLTGVQLSFVPYRGTGPALQDLVAGQIDLIIDQASNCLPQVRQGTIKAYAVTANQRLASAAEIPTVAEAGLPGLLMEVWSGMWVPHGTPRPIVDKLNAAVVAALKEPAVREKLASVGLDGPPAGEEAPEALAAYQKAEVAKWWPIIKAANVAAE